MPITKTNFINYSRCPRYAALDNIKKEKLLSDISYDEYLEEENLSHIEEILGNMFEVDENGEEVDLVDKLDRQLEAMLPYYNKVEEEAGKIAKKYFGGTVKYAADTKSQECFDFNRNGFNYLCYIDVYNEVDDKINIIEVKATTTNKYMNLKSNHKKCEKYSIFHKIDNILYLKDEIDGYDIQREMPLENYQKQKEKLFDRYKEGSYVFDLAIQRFIIEGEYKQSNNEDKIKNFRYYLGVLNADYTFSGKYIDNEPVYEPDENGEELITFIDLTKVTGELQPFIISEADKLERYIKNSDTKECPLGKWCTYKKKNQCKFFNAICGKKIPKKNSSLSYVNNGQGFKTLNGERLKGLDLINEGYINLMDVPEEWITNPNHIIERNCYQFDTIYIDKEKLSAGLKMLEYPIYHLDFETFPCPVPRFKGEKPYIQSPFEFSLHIEREPGVCDFDKDNYIFLNSDLSDQREEMIKAMLKYMDPNKGTLFAQNVTFEKGRIKEMAECFPKYKNELMKLHDRGFDLLWLVNTNSKMYEELGFDKEKAKMFNYYNKALSGSFSIKKTLPVFSDLSYDKLVVKNGTEAIVEYANYDKMSKEEFNLKYEALKIYCKQDTWAMVLILEALRQLVK